MNGNESPLSPDVNLVTPFDRPGLNFPIPPDVTSEFLTAFAELLPLETRFGGAVITVNNFSQNGLFVGQPPEFVRTLLRIAEEADSALGH
jgi:hypothetical protein